jgi:hypothetical protein
LAVCFARGNDWRNIAITLINAPGPQGWFEWPHGTSVSDLDECVDVVNAVEAENTIPKSISQPSRPAVFCGLDLRLPFLRQLDRVSIYGVVDGGKQVAIIATLQAYRQRTHTKPLLVRFYARENWQKETNPSTGVRHGWRGPETLIRENPLT